MTLRGAGTLRQRRPGSWEVRVSVGPNPVTGRAVQRSITVYGGLADAEQARALLAAQAGQVRAQRQRPLQTVADLLEVWLAAEHDWKPSTWQNYRLAAGRLTADPLSGRQPDRLSPPVLRAAMRTWQQHGVPPSTIALHVRTLKAALGWAFDQRLIASPPLQGMHGPSPGPPRRDVPLEVVRQLLSAAEHDLAHAAAAPASAHQQRRLHTAEQVQLLLRLAADTGARRGELDALQTSDLHGRVLHIDRGVSAEIVTTTKTGRTRRVTLGADTIQLWHHVHHSWQLRLPDELLGPWVFSAHHDHQQRLPAGTLGHWFAAFVRRHGHADVCLHRLRHTVATVLVADGLLLQAQQRLGHAEASTTLRQYCHALPLHDQDVADHLNTLLQHPPPPPPP